MTLEAAMPDSLRTRRRNRGLFRALWLGWACVTFAASAQAEPRVFYIPGTFPQAQAIELTRTPSDARFCTAELEPLDRQRAALGLPSCSGPGRALAPALRSADAVLLVDDRAPSSSLQTMLGPAMRGQTEGTVRLAGGELAATCASGQLARVYLIGWSEPPRPAAQAPTATGATSPPQSDSTFDCTPYLSGGPPMRLTGVGVAGPAPGQGQALFRFDRLASREEAGQCIWKISTGWSGDLTPASEATVPGAAGNNEARTAFRFRLDFELENPRNQPRMVREMRRPVQSLYIATFGIREKLVFLTSSEGADEILAWVRTLAPGRPIAREFSSLPDDRHFLLWANVLDASGRTQLDFWQFMSTDAYSYQCTPAQRACTPGRWVEYARWFNGCMRAVSLQQAGPPSRLSVGAPQCTQRLEANPRIRQIRDDLQITSAEDYPDFYQFAEFQR